MIEPYYEGSHKLFIDGLASHLSGNLGYAYSLVTLPGRKWKQRMRLATIPIVKEVSELMGEKGFQAIICGSMLNLAELKGLEPRLAKLPSMVYFHENQLAYPTRHRQAEDVNLAAVSAHSALAADIVAFNSEYNRETFLLGLESLSRKIVDVDLKAAAKEIRGKSTTVYPPIAGAGASIPAGTSGAPLILWNHRWEYDKNPEAFFRTMLDLDRAGREFSLAVVGKSYGRVPEVFERAKKALSHRIVAWGFQRSRAKYLELLRAASLVVSTADQEFFGISVMEAVAAGCRPFVPDRLSYRELYPREFRYSSRSELLRGLKRLLSAEVSDDGWDRARLARFAQPYTWEQLGPRYGALVDQLLRGGVRSKVQGVRSEE